MERESDTETLVKRAAGGDRVAFDEIVARFRGSLEVWVHSRLGPKLRRRIEADDILQQTFLWAFRGIGALSWKGEETFHGWLVSIARNVIRKEADRGERHGLLWLDRDVAASDPAASGLLRRHERFDRLQEALGRLSSEHRRVIELARIEGLAVREIARRTGRTPGAVSQLLRRALARLRESFGDTESLSLPPRRFQMGAGREGERDGPRREE